MVERLRLTTNYKISVSPGTFLNGRQQHLKWKPRILINHCLGDLCNSGCSGKAEGSVPMLVPHFQVSGHHHLHQLLNEFSMSCNCCDMKSSLLFPCDFGTYCRSLVR
ncbi:hypothetical protein EUGRSUZ_E04254 [Eucalyptus grandis]|uniref:Uncharacterized protein n=2 Tax=Eucalyptus grandis TaxID=71139 RepID=A0ACC3L1J9_EUCGR|nr:hypothetical protein EUGRSUZ_E04254 [Eucalyptus grandis]